MGPDGSISGTLELSSLASWITITMLLQKEPNEIQIHVLTIVFSCCRYGYVKRLSRQVWKASQTLGEGVKPMYPTG